MVVEMVSSLADCSVALMVDEMVVHLADQWVWKLVGEKDEMKAEWMVGMKVAM